MDLLLPKFHHWPWQDKEVAAWVDIHRAEEGSDNMRDDMAAVVEVDEDIEGADSTGEEEVVGKQKLQLLVVVHRWSKKEQQQRLFALRPLPLAAVVVPSTAPARCDVATIVPVTFVPHQWLSFEAHLTEAKMPSKQQDSGAAIAAVVRMYPLEERTEVVG